MPQHHGRQEQTTSVELSGLSRRLRHFALRVIPVLAGLHAYIGWRLLPALHPDIRGMTLGVALLCLSTLLVPLGMLARFLVARPVLADRISWVGSLSMGLFSTILVLTLLRDLFLLVAG